MRFSLIRVGLITCFTTLAFSQGLGESAARFEVATVKPSGTNGWTGLSWRGDRLLWHSAPLGSMVQVAYNLQEYQLAGGPEWLWRNTYTIEAKAPSAVSLLQMKPMLRNLLVDRFKLSTHTESRQLNAFALAVGKGGPKFQLLAEGSRPKNAPRRDALTFTHIYELMGFLGKVTGRPIIDKTGLQGNFDIFVDFSGYTTPPGVEPGSSADRDANSEFIEAAILKQTGLTITPGKSPIEVLVIDSAAIPRGD